MEPGQGEAAAMRRAVELAGRGLGGTSPNPVVGCVVLDAQGEPAGEGHHTYAGGPHAEVVALSRAAGRARGGTLVVTLEPCNRTGRTGPCVRAISAAGIRRVVYAVADPHAAGGADALRAAGIEVDGGLLAAEAERVNIAWLTYVRLRRPHVTWKFAASLDGRSAAADGTSRWITGPEARADAHRLRARCDAVIVGSGTVLADDPQLTVRSPGGAGRTPLRVVVDTGARTPPDARILDGAAPTLVAVADDAYASALECSAAVVRLPRTAAGHLDLTALLVELRAREVVSALLEGGPTLAGAFIAAGLVDEVVGYLAPMLLGGDGGAEGDRGRSALGAAGITTLAEAHRLELEDVTTVGPDLRITGAVRRAAHEKANATGEPARQAPPPKGS